MDLYIKLLIAFDLILYHIKGRTIEQLFGSEKFASTIVLSYKEVPKFSWDFRPYLPPITQKPTKSWRSSLIRGDSNLVNICFQAQYSMGIIDKRPHYCPFVGPVFLAADMDLTAELEPNFIFMITRWDLKAN
jgi:hypothetical protein